MADGKKSHAAKSHTAQGDTASAKPTATWVTPGLVALVANLGDASRDEVESLVGGVSREDRIAEGRKVVTTRIDADGERIGRVAAEFLATAPKDPEDDPRPSVDIDLDVVRITAWALLQGHLGYRELVGDRVSHKGEQKALEVTAVNLTERLRLQRTRLATLIRNASGQKSAVIARINHALTPAAAGAVEVGPDASIRELVTVGRELLEAATPDDLKRFKRFTFTEAKLAGYETAANEAGPTLRAAGAPAVKSTVSQAEVDFWDGTNLLLLGIILDAFNAAAALDHRVPRLGVVSLQGVLTGHSRGTAATPRDPPVTPPTK